MGPTEWAQLSAGDAAAQVKIGIETEGGPWVASPVATGYEVFAINPMSTARYRERHSPSKAKIQAVLRAPALRQPPAVQLAFAAIVAGEVRLIEALNAEIDALGQVVAEHFGRHPDADLCTSQPGLGVILGARVLAEFGDDPKRYADAKARKNYAETAPITRASATKKTVLARHVHDDRLSDAVHQWALGSLRGSPGARAYSDAMRARKIGRHAALRQLGNRIVGILHGCLKTRTPTTKPRLGPIITALHPLDKLMQRSLSRR